MPEGTIESPRIEPPQFLKKERISLRKKIVRQLRRVLKPKVRHPQSDDLSPPGLLDVEKMEAIRKKKEHEKRKSDQGCAFRAIVSATAFASGESNIGAEKDEWAAGFSFWPTHAEWEARFNQIDEGNKSKAAYEKDLLDLYDGYRQNPTPLGKALGNVTIIRNGEETLGKIKERILKGKDTGEQVMIFQIEPETKTSHFFHAGYKGGRFISFSDGKLSKRKYTEPVLNQKTYTTFSVIKNDTNPAPANGN